MRFGIPCLLYVLIFCSFCCRPICAAESAIETLHGLDGAALDSLSIPEPTLVPAEGISKGSTNNITLLILKELGNPPSREEEKIIKKALEALNASKVGKEICKTIGADGCTWNNLQVAGVQITTRDLKYHLPEPLESILGPLFGDGDPSAAAPNPSEANGKTFLCLDQELVGKNSAEYVATFILHEISHISDNRKLGEVASRAQKYAAEYKAHFVQMMIYDEFLRTGKLKGNTATSGIQFMLSVYRWRNGCPKPNMDYSVKIKGKVYSAEELIGLYGESGDNGLKALWRLTGFYIQRPDEVASDGDAKFLQGIHSAVKSSESKYVNWFPPQVVAPNPGPSPQPQPQPNPQPNPVPPPTPQPKPALSVDSDSLNFYGQETQYDPDSQRIGIRNSGNGTLDWKVSSDASWLSLSPSKGSSTGETDYVTVEVESGLSEGTYRAEITVSAGSFTHIVRVMVEIEPYEIDVDPADRRHSN